MLKNHSRPFQILSCCLLDVALSILNQSKHIWADVFICVRPQIIYLCSCQCNRITKICFRITQFWITNCFYFIIRPYFFKGLWIWLIYTKTKRPSRIWGQNSEAHAALLSLLLSCVVTERSSRAERKSDTSQVNPPSPPPSPSWNKSIPRLPTNIHR